jgi:hypothetical protein
VAEPEKKDGDQAPPPGLEKTVPISAEKIVGEDDEKFPDESPAGEAPAAADGAPAPDTDPAQPGPAPGPEEAKPDGKQGSGKARGPYNKKRSRGRPAGSKSAPKFDDVPSGEERPEAEEPQGIQIDNRMVSEKLFDTWIYLMVSIFGPEWAPRKAPEGSGIPDERETVIGPLTSWLETFVIKIVTPFQMMYFSVVMYCIPRLFHPNTRAKIFAFFKGAFRGLFFIFRGGKPKASKEPRPLRVVQEEAV